MNFKKRVLCLFSAVIVLAPYLYFAYQQPVDIGLPYVEGWYPNTSKNIDHYVDERLQPIIMPKNFCSQRALLLVIVHVIPYNFEVRSAIRDTWAQKGHNISFYFLIGEDKNHHYEMTLRLQQESKLYNDIIQERFVDSYNNLTLKSVNMLKLFNRYCSKSHKYLMKIDEDVFLNVQNVLKMLNNRTTHKDLLIGKLINYTEPFRDPTSKWYVPYELYPKEKYPPYLCGPMYLMSSDMAERLYRCAKNTPIFFIEDVYITGICAEKINVAPQNHPMIKCLDMQKYICLHKREYSLHRYKPEDLRTSYRLLKDDSCPERGSFKEWIFSFFYS